MFIPHTEQRTDAIDLVARILSLHPPERIVEIGTGRGYWTTLLAIVTGAPIITIDNQVRLQWECPVVPGSVERVVADVFSFDLDLSGRIWLMCDGGNKDREMRTFGPQLESGAVLWVHDVPTDRDWEAAAEVDAAPWAEANGYVTLHNDLWYVGVRQ